MAYNIPRSDLTKPDIVVLDATVNNTATSLDLVGRNYPSYGEFIATTQVHMLENFASTIAPINPVPGQLWYDSGATVLKVNQGPGDNATGAWVAVGAGGGVTTFVALTDTPSSYTGQAGKVVVVNGLETALEFITPAAGGGEANTSSNSPAAGTFVGLALPKSGVNLPFKQLVQGTGVVLSDLGAGGIQIDATGIGGGEANTGSNLGTGAGKVFALKSGVDLQFKSIKAGTGITVSQNSTDVTINSTAGGGDFFADGSVPMTGNLQMGPNGIILENNNTPAEPDCQIIYGNIFGGAICVITPPTGTTQAMSFAVNVNTDVGTPANNRSVAFVPDGNVLVSTGVVPTSPAHLTTKAYVDANTGANYYSNILFDSVGGVTSGSINLSQLLFIAPTNFRYRQVIIEGYSTNGDPVAGVYFTQTIDIATLRIGVPYTTCTSGQGDVTGTLVTTFTDYDTIAVNGAFGARLKRVIGISYNGVPA